MTSFYQINDQSLHVHEEGNVKRQAAILIHGWSSSWFAMSPLIPILQKRYHCYAVDLPGYGQSPHPPHNVTIAWYADTLADFIRHISPDKPAVLIGHSMGGMISLTMALRHPDVVERLVLIAPTISGRLSLFINLFIWPVTFIERFFWTDQLISLIEPHTVWATDNLMKPASFAEHSHVDPQDYVRLRTDARRPGQGRIRAECFRAMRDNDLRGKLDKLAVPALMLWGLEDNTVPLRDASAVASECPDADMRFIPGASHWPQFETPQLTQRYIEGFLGRPLNLLKMSL